jgi:hypothetical protein
MAMKRTHIIEPQIGENGELIQQRGKGEQIALDLLNFLWSGGGSIRIVSDRVRLGTLPGGEPLAETVGLVIEFDAAAPMHKESLTEALLNAAFADDGEPARPAPRADAVAAPASDDDDDGSGILDGDEDEDEEG